MPIDRRTFPYEILVRLGPDGYVASHVVDCTQIFEGKTVHAETLGDARAVTQKEVGALLGKENARLIEQREAEKARADTAERDCERGRVALQVEIEEARAEAAALRAERDQAVDALEAVRQAVAPAPTRG
jgi:hypothetical protein